MEARADSLAKAISATTEWVEESTHKNFIYMASAAAIVNGLSRTLVENKKGCENKCPSYRRIYESKKHGGSEYFENGKIVSRAPSNGQAILDLAIPLGGNSSRLIGFDPVIPAHVAIFDRQETIEWPECIKIYHGHVPNIDGLNARQKILAVAKKSFPLLNKLLRKL